jgi:phosphoglucosamine mutase
MSSPCDPSLPGASASAPQVQDPGMARRLFGTDGIRGCFGHHPLERAVIEQVAYELTRGLSAPNGRKPLVVAGGDTRESTEEIARWIATGVRAGGGVVRWAGVIPTPGVAWLVRHLSADAGVVISASHNPHPDNGVKILSADGFKLGDESERQIEAGVRGSRHSSALDANACEALAVEEELLEAYAAELLSRSPEGGSSTDPSLALRGLRVGLDAGNGAATPLAARVFEQLGASVVIVGDRPDGRNVNAGCGSTSPENLARLVREQGLDIGFAFDGDADRVIACDDQGTVRDGDDLLYIWARHLERAGLLAPAAVVATSMSNLGLEHALRRDGIEVVRCDVGDRQVVETLRGRGLILGGEPSGHLVHLGLATTGDGLLTALQVAGIVRRAAVPASRLFDGFERFPQVLRNVRVTAKPAFAALDGLSELVASVEHRLGAEGRLVLRYSGTEPLVRVMIEGQDADTIDRLAGELTEFFEQRLGIETAHV